ncbi:hypothetical protein PCE1_001860 [Barthelona sp. PCE]
MFSRHNSYASIEGRDLESALQTLNLISSSSRASKTASPLQSSVSSIIPTSISGYSSSHNGKSVKDIDIDVLRNPMSYNFLVYFIVVVMGIFFLMSGARTAAYVIDIIHHNSEMSDAVFFNVLDYDASMQVTTETGLLAPHLYLELEDSETLFVTEVTMGPFPSINSASSFAHDVGNHTVAMHYFRDSVYVTSYGLEGWSYMILLVLAITVTAMLGYIKYLYWFDWNVIGVYLFILHSAQDNVDANVGEMISSEEEEVIDEIDIMLRQSLSVIVENKIDKRDSLQMFNSSFEFDDASGSETDAKTGKSRRASGNDWSSVIELPSVRAISKGISSFIPSFKNRISRKLSKHFGKEVADEFSQSNADLDRMLDSLNHFNLETEPLDVPTLSLQGIDSSGNPTHDFSSEIRSIVISDEDSVESMADGSNESDYEDASPFMGKEMFINGSLGKLEEEEVENFFTSNIDTGVVLGSPQNLLSPHHATDVAINRIVSTEVSRSNSINSIERLDEVEAEVYVYNKSGLSSKRTSTLSITVDQTLSPVILEEIEDEEDEDLSIIHDNRGLNRVYSNPKL